MKKNKPQRIEIKQPDNLPKVIRMKAETHQKIREFSKRTHKPAKEVLEEMVEIYGEELEIIEKLSKRKPLQKTWADC